MEVLILSCGTGGGHNAAGHAVEAELKRRGHSVTFFNPYDLRSRALSELIDQAYIKWCSGIRNCSAACIS